MAFHVTPQAQSRQVQVHRLRKINVCVLCRMQCIWGPLCYSTLTSHTHSIFVGVRISECAFFAYVHTCTHINYASNVCGSEVTDKYKVVQKPCGTESCFLSIFSKSFSLWASKCLDVKETSSSPKRRGVTEPDKEA